MYDKIHLVNYYFYEVTDMDILLHNFEVFPKVFLGDREKTITIKPLGDHSRFDPSCEYIVRILKCAESSMTSYPERSGRTVLKIHPEQDGSLILNAYFMGEGEHTISIYEEGVKAPKYVFSVYSLNEDMKGRLRKVEKSIIAVLE